jgi:hypothetical protein
MEAAAAVDKEAPAVVQEVPMEDMETELKEAKMEGTVMATKVGEEKIEEIIKMRRRRRRRKKKKKKKKKWQIPCMVNCK